MPGGDGRTIKAEVELGTEGYMSMTHICTPSGELGLDSSTGLSCVWVGEQSAVAADTARGVAGVGAGACGDPELVLEMEW